MGCCMTNDPVTHSIDQNMKQSYVKDKKYCKLLLLGPGGSGKSTVFKQLRYLHNDGYNEQETLSFVKYIHSHILQQMKQAIKGISNMSKKEPNNFKSIEKFSKQSQQFIELIVKTDLESPLTQKLANAIEHLWQNESIFQYFYSRSDVPNKLDENVKHFLDDIQTIAQSTYIPSKKDILDLRHRTTGIIEQKFSVPSKKTLFHIFDVGGQQSERKKWIQLFDGSVTAVLFIASISCYNEVMFEDSSINCMVDTLFLWKEIVNHKIFSRTPMILFLNKTDLLIDKLQKKISLNQCMTFNDAAHDMFNYDEVVIYITQKFLNEINPNGYHIKSNQIYIHTTCALDDNSVEKVWLDVQNALIRNVMDDAGLLLE